MAKRKYTRFGEEPAAYECSNKKCKWQGSDAEKIPVQFDDIETRLCCRKCHNDEFYGLLTIPFKADR